MAFGSWGKESLVLLESASPQWTVETPGTPPPPHAGFIFELFVSSRDCFRRLSFAPFSEKRRFDRWREMGRYAGRWIRFWSSTEDAVVEGGEGGVFRIIRPSRSCSRKTECEGGGDVAGAGGRRARIFFCFRFVCLAARLTDQTPMPTIPPTPTAVSSILNMNANAGAISKQRHQSPRKVRQRTRAHGRGVFFFFFFSEAPTCNFRMLIPHPKN